MSAADRILAAVQAIGPGQVRSYAQVAAAAGLPGEARALTAWSERTAPWRSYLSAHLWRAAPVRPAASRRASAAHPAPTGDTTTKETS